MSSRLLPLALALVCGACSGAARDAAPAPDTAGAEVEESAPEEPAAETIATPSEGQDLIGTQAREWELDGWLRGDPQALADQRGSPVLIRFFTNTCPFCASSMPAFQRLHERHREEGLKVLGFYHPKPLGAPRSNESVERMLESWGVTFDIALDTEWRTLRRYWLDGHRRGFTSVSFLIDRQGKLRYIHPGPELHPEGAACNRDAAACAGHFADLENAIEVLLSE